MRKTVTRARRGGGAVASGGPMIHWIAKDVSRPCVAREISLASQSVSRGASSRCSSRFRFPHCLLASKERWLVLFSRSIVSRSRCLSSTWTCSWTKATRLTRPTYVYY